MRFGRVGVVRKGIGRLNLWPANGRFRRMKTLQKFASVHASVHNLFNQERHLTSRQTYKERRSEALSEWRAVMD